MDNEFLPCDDHCAACCKQVGKIIVVALAHVLDALSMQKEPSPFMKEVSEFPYDLNEDGSCSMLDENLKCKVYGNRPGICNAEEMYHRYWEEMLSVEEWYIKSRQSCERLKELICRK